MTASEDLARFTTDLKFEDIPPHVVAASKRFLIDTLGVALSGAVSAQGEAVQGYLREIGGPEEATVLGTRLRVGRMQAALGNGIQIRARELEDTFEEGFMHGAPGAIGAPLALIERHPCTGKELLTAIALGYEVSTRVSRAVSPSHANRGYHPTSTCGVFGATAAAGRLLGLTEPQIGSALGIAGLQAAGIMQSSDPAWRYLTAIDGGRAAHLGVTAALLALHGFPGSPQIFEAPYGFCAMHADEFDPELITKDLGTDYVMPEVGIKMYPASRPTHPSISAGSILKERHNIDPEEISEVVITGFAEAMDMGNKPNPQSELDAQGSQQYLVSVALTRGNYTLEDVSPQAVEEPEIRKLMAKVKLMPDPELDQERLRQPSKWPTQVEVRMVDGSTYTERVDYPPGSAGNPPTPDQLRDKYISLATQVVPEGQAREMWGLVHRLDEFDDVGRLVNLWQAPD